MENQTDNKNSTSIIKVNSNNLETATLAGGCFWCIEASLKEIKGIQSVISGYTGGTTLEPNYQTVSSGKTGHYEAVKVEFDNTIIDYKTIIEKFFELIDPTDDLGSFADKGSQYKSAIFYKNENEKQIAEKIIQKLEDSKVYNNKIVTKLIDIKTFYKAEEDHQDYYRKAPIRYNQYKKYSKREEYFNEISKKKEELRFK